MLKKEQLDTMINCYKEIMIVPSLERLEKDKYDKVELVDNYDATSLTVRFIAVRTRPDKYMINKMYCLLATVSIFEIERWYEEYSKLFANTTWSWKY